MKIGGMAGELVPLMDLDEPRRKGKRRLPAFQLVLPPQGRMIAKNPGETDRVLFD
jgi:hypothetical protein